MKNIGNFLRKVTNALKGLPDIEKLKEWKEQVEDDISDIQLEIDFISKMKTKELQRARKVKEHGNDSKLRSIFLRIKDLERDEEVNEKLLYQKFIILHALKKITDSYKYIKNKVDEKRLAKILYELENIQNLEKFSDESINFYLEEMDNTLKEVTEGNISGFKSELEREFQQFKASLDMENIRDGEMSSETITPNNTDSTKET